MFFTKSVYKFTQTCISVYKGNKILRKGVHIFYEENDFCDNGYMHYDVFA